MNTECTLYIKIKINKNSTFFNLFIQKISGLYILSIEISEFLAIKKSLGEIAVISFWWSRFQNMSM